MMTADEYIAKATWLADMHALSGPTEHTRRAIEEHAMTAIRRNKEVREMLEEEAERAGDLAARLAESERCRGALMEELENIATAEWRTFDPDTRRCAYEFVLWAQSRARHTLNRVLSGDVTAPLPEDEDKYLAKKALWGMRLQDDDPDPALTKLDEMVLREK